MKKNCMVGQSGGPTAAINASLAGVIEEAYKPVSYTHLTLPTIA